MGLLNKLKNALFEEEYVEVEEKPKKVKKDKPKKEEMVKEKPVAKKVILPGKKNEKVEELHEEELIDEDFEIRPKSDVVDEIGEDSEQKLEQAPTRMSREEFKMMNDDDFKVEEEVSDSYEEPEIVQVLGRRTNNFNDYYQEKPRRSNDDYDNDDFEDSYRENNYQEKAYKNDNYKEDSGEARTLYGMSDSDIKVQDYGLYEKKTEKGYFRPSPIISPIYGILDKNYRKEDVVAKKDVRVASSYSRKRVDIDDVRRKAYGSLSDDIEKEFSEPEVEDSSFEVKDVDEKRLVDLSADDSKPTVKEVTVGDAVEYFQDLGLEYNVDYVDATKENLKKKRSRVEEKANVQSKIDEEKVADEAEEAEFKVDEEPVMKKEKKVMAAMKVETVEPVSEDDSLLDTSDNLFDLIDSMYRENE